MKALTSNYVSIEALRDVAKVLTGMTPTDEFSGDTLDVPTARSIAETLALPGGATGRVVICSFSEIRERSVDVLLAPLEECDSSFFMSTQDRLPETLRSRLDYVPTSYPSLEGIYESFSRLNNSYDLELVYDLYPDVPRGSISSLFNQYMQSLGTVGKFLSDISDGNHESALRTSLLFSDKDIELFFIDIEAQLAGSGVCGVDLSMVDRRSLYNVLSLSGKRSDTSARLIASLAAYLLV